MKRWFDIVLAFLPTILGLIQPNLAPIAGGIATAVNEAEQAFGPGTGAQKLAHVQQAAVDLAGDVNLAKGTTVIDPATLGATVAAGVSVGVGIVNLFTKVANTPVAAIAVAPAV